MERHANKTNATETIKVPLQQLSKSGKTLFAYMRRSTTKKEQASSLPQQEEGIEYLAKALGVDIGEIRAYTESRSGYENRKRPEWNKMIGEIDKLKEPCIILCRDTSRLSRNPTDNLAIANRIFGDNGQKKVIQSIYYLGTAMKIEEWNDKTNKKHIVDTLHQNYTDSMENKEKCIAGVLLKLEQGEFPYCPPHGLKRVNREGLPRKTRNEKTTLMQDEEMQFVRHAFEMKAKGRTAKEICQYLKQYGNISISTKNIIETLIGNTVYKGIYTEKTTGTYFENIKFWEGKPPIDPELWERANAKVGKRGYGFGEGQAEHIAPGILKHESGKSLYMYKAKGKYNAYQTEIKGENGKRKTVGMMEKDIVKGFLDEVVPRIKLAYYILTNSEDPREKVRQFKSLSKKEREEKVKELNLSYKRLFEATGDEQDNIQFHTFEDCLRNYEVLQEQMIDSSFELSKGDLNLEELDAEINILFGLDSDDMTMPKEGDYNRKEEKEALIRIIKESIIGKQKFKEIFKTTIVFEQDKNEKTIHEEQKKSLIEKKQLLEEEKRNIDKKAFKLGYSADIANEMKEDTEKEIREIESQIDSLSESTNMEEYLDRLPEILQNLHELSSRVLTEAEYGDMRNDIKQLIEIVSHELILSDKKELKVKLFEGIESIERGKIGYGATFSKGYFLLPLYFKVRKRQYGKKWTTQFVTLCRDEVIKLEEYKKSLQLENDKNTVATFLAEVEKETVIV